MSQIFKATVNSSNLPDDVPTQFTADDATKAVPVNHNLNVFSEDTIQNEDNGIQTTASGDTLTIQLTNRTVVTAITSDGGGQNQPVTVMTPVNGSALTFRVSVTGYDASNVQMTGGEIIGIARKSGGVVTVVHKNDIFDESDGVANDPYPANGLTATTWDIEASGADIIIRFVGESPRTITWKALFEYIQAAP